MEHPDSTQFDLSGQDDDDGGAGVNLPDDFEQNAVLYAQAKAEVARLAAALGIERGWDGEYPAAVPEGPPSPRGGTDRAGAAYPTRFGRGWIPAGRDIGLPGDGAVEAPRRACLEEAVPASPADYRFTPPRRALFLHHLAEQGSVEAACARIGISRQAAYLARRRDAAFRAGWEAALVHARAWSEQVLACRAIEGVREAVYYRGELVGERVRFDSRLLLAHLARLDAAAEAPHAAERAERFDELLALVAGETHAAELDEADDGCGGATDPLLPVERGRYVWERGCELERELAEAQESADPRELFRAAQDRAAEEWDRWGARVAAVDAALALGEAPVPAAGDPVAEGADIAPPPTLSPLSTCGPVPPAGGAGAGGVSLGGEQA